MASIEKAARAAYGDDFVNFLDLHGAEYGVIRGKMKSGENYEILCPHHAAGHGGKKAYATRTSLCRCNACGHKSGGWVKSLSAFSGMGLSEEDVRQRLAQDPNVRAHMGDAATTYRPAPLQAFLSKLRQVKDMTGTKFLDEKRGVDERTQNEDGWLFCPAKPPRMNGYSLKELVEADILRRRDQKGDVPEDQWEVTNPWKGRVVTLLGDGTLYGRAVRADAFVPHMYSLKKKQALLHKKRIQDAASKGTLRKVILVESALDASSCNRLVRGAGMRGIWVPAATLGTKGISDQLLVDSLKEAKEANAEIVFIADHDEAMKDGVPHHPGQTAALDKANKLVAEGFRVRMARIKQVGADPNDLTAKLNYSPEQFRSLIEEAVTPLEFALWVEREEYGKNFGDDAKRGYWESAVRLIRKHWDASMPEDDIIAFVARMGGWNPESVRKALSSELDKLSKRHLFNSTKSVIAELLQKGVSKEKIRTDLGLS